MKAERLTEIKPSVGLPIKQGISWRMFFKTAPATKCLFHGGQVSDTLLTLLADEGIMPPDLADHFLAVMSVALSDVCDGLAGYQGTLLGEIQPPFVSLQARQIAKYTFCDIPVAPKRVAALNP
jgi:hypothetical protein